MSNYAKRDVVVDPLLSRGCFSEAVTFNLVSYLSGLREVRSATPFSNSVALSTL